MISRRESLKKIFSGVGAAAFGSSLLPQLTQAATALTSYAGGPKRVIFFMQNQGFDPKSCIPTGVANNGSLASAILPKQIEALLSTASTAFTPALLTVPFSELSVAIVAVMACLLAHQPSIMSWVKSFPKLYSLTSASGWTPSRVWPPSLLLQIYPQVGQDNPSSCIRTRTIWLWAWGSSFLREWALRKIYTGAKWYEHIAWKIRKGL